jgi:DNA-binding NtrC family response regulator
MTKKPTKTKILIIEDEVALGEIYKDNLKEAGYQSKWVASIKDAEKTAKTFSAELLLIDHSLDTGKDGVEGADDLKKCFPDAVFIVLSNYSAFDIEKQAKSRGYTKNLKLIHEFWNKLDCGACLAEKIAAFLKR